ncbi:hypothetical protein ACFSUK_33245 [Sphingobium scionense]
MDIDKVRRDAPNSQVEPTPRQGVAAVSTTRRSMAPIPSMARAPLRSASKCAAHSPMP